jgi:hypothetical protein
MPKVSRRRHQSACCASGNDKENAQPVSSRNVCFAFDRQSLTRESSPPE